MLNNKYLFKNFAPLIFIFLFVLLFFLYGFNEIIFMRPQSVHQWRQCDCLAFTQTYYQDHNNFFEPQILYLGDDGTGKTSSDFPLIYYSVAQLWKIFGKHEFIYRALVLILSFTGLFFFFRMIEDLLQDSFIALWVSFILYSSPMFVYYSNNFLMNVPAFSLALIALYFFYRFYKSSQNKYLYISMLIYTLAGLLKIPALTSFAAITGLLFLELTGIVKFEKKIFFNLKKQIPAFLLVILIVPAWYIYAGIYNNKYNSGIFLIGILPVWLNDLEETKRIINQAKILWFDSYQSLTIQYLAMVMLILVLSAKKYINKTIWWLTLLLFSGFVLFIILWFDVFDNHDYYLINQLIFMQSIFVAFFIGLKKYNIKIYRNIFFRTLLLIALINNIIHCKNIIRLRYYGWPNKEHLEHTKALETISHYLRSIGINDNDKVLYLNDYSFNISLYLMEQKGYTNFGKKLQDSIFFKEKIKEGAKYLFIDTKTFTGKNQLNQYCKNKIGTYKNISIYKLDN